MLPDSSTMTVINTRHRCRICFAILKAPIHGKTSTYYSVHSNRRLGASELSLLPFLEEGDNQLLQHKCTSISNDRSTSCSSMSFKDLMERFLRVSVDSSSCMAAGNTTETVLIDNVPPVKTVAATSHSDIICLKCSSVLTKIFELHLALQKLASSLREKYLKTLKIVGNADIQQQRKSNGHCCQSNVSLKQTPVLLCNNEVKSPPSNERTMDEEHRENQLSTKSNVFCKKYGLKLKSSADSIFLCECQKSKKKCAKENLHTSKSACDNATLANSQSFKSAGQNKCSEQWNRLSKRKGKPRHHVKIGDRRVGPSDANRFRLAAHDEFCQPNRISSRLCSIIDDTNAAVESPELATIEGFNSYKQCQTTEIEKVVEKDSRLTDQAFTIEQLSERTCLAKPVTAFTDINLQQDSCTDDIVDRPAYTAAIDHKSDSCHQEEDEENGARSLLCSAECTKAQTKCCGAQECTINREYMPVNDDRRAKANNINRIAATLMGDCNSTDSMDVEESYSPGNAVQLCGEQHGIADTCCNSCSNLDDFFNDSCPSNVVNSNNSSNKDAIFPSYRTGDTTVTVNFKGDQQHLVGCGKHHKRLRNEYCESNLAADGPSKLVNRSQQINDGLKYRHNQDSYFTSLKLSSNAAFDNVSGPEDVNSCRFNAAFSPVAIDSICKASGGLNESKASGAFECSIGTSKGVSTSSVVDQSSVANSLIPPNSGDLKNSAALVGGCLVNKNTRGSGGGVSTSVTTSKMSTPAHHPQLHSRQLGNFKRYQCGFCGKIVTNIQIHVRRHTNEKPYRCEYCEKRFTNSGDLQIHTRIHTGEKPYRCPICAKSYRTIGNFNSHVKTHDRGERPHRCVLCNETFEQTRDWFSHLRSNHKVLPTSPSSKIA